MPTAFFGDLVNTRPAILCLTLLLGACAGEGTALQAWWGPVDGAEFASGGSFGTAGLAHEFTTQVAGSERDYVGVVLVGGEDGPASCSVYVDYLRRIQEAQDYLEEAFLEDPRPPAEEWSEYVCQAMRGASVEAFGGDGAYRAVHALLDITGGSVPGNSLFLPASLGGQDTEFPGAEVLTEAGTFVGRMYERSRHGDGILPAGEVPGRESDVDPIAGCSTIARALVDELDRGRDVYPDRRSVVLQAGTHRYYHHHTEQAEVGLGEADPLVIGISLPSWETVGLEGGAGAMTAFGQVSRAPEVFPYEQILLSTRSEALNFESCPLLSQYTSLVWPELLGAPGWAGDLGDDDDSAE